LEVDVLSDRVRREIYEGLRSVMSDEAAEGAMSVLPWSRPATVDDLAAFEVGLRGEMAELRGDLRGEMAELRGEMAELRGEMFGLRGELRGEMSELRGQMSELRSEMAELRSAINVRLVVANGIASTVTIGVLLAAGALL
jgi:ribosomal protein L29